MKFETNSLGEVKVYERLAKYVKKIKTFPDVLYTGLIASTAITEGDSLAEFVTDSGLPVTAALSVTRTTANYLNII